MTRKTHGFTVAEFLVVNLIIAVLMAILMPALNRVKREARMSYCIYRDPVALAFEVKAKPIETSSTIERDYEVLKSLLRDEMDLMTRRKKGDFGSGKTKSFYADRVLVGDCYHCTARCDDHAIRKRPNYGVTYTVRKTCLAVCRWMAVFGRTPFSQYAWEMARLTSRIAASGGNIRGVTLRRSSAQTPKAILSTIARARAGPTCLRKDTGQAPHCEPFY